MAQEGDARKAGRARVNRRGFMIMGAAGATGPLTAIASTRAQSKEGGFEQERPAPVSDTPAWLFFNSDEAQFVVAAVDTFIPAEGHGPGGVEAGVPVFIDRQLAGAYGQGDRLYLQGPFAAAPLPQQGYQLALTPAELIRAGIAEARAHAYEKHGSFFQDLGLADRTAFMSALEKGEIQFTQTPAKGFFNLLLELTMEGYFADPIYGGNKSKMVWNALGFPGAGVIFTDKIVAYRNKPYVVPAKSVTDLA